MSRFRAVSSDDTLEGLPDRERIRWAGQARPESSEDQSPRDPTRQRTYRPTRRCDRDERQKEAALAVRRSGLADTAVDRR